MFFKWTFVLIAIFSFPLAARGADAASAEAAARRRLEALKVPYTAEAFIDAVRRGETETAKTFLEAGMSPKSRTPAEGRRWSGPPETAMRRWRPRLRPEQGDEHRRGGRRGERLRRHARSPPEENGRVAPVEKGYGLDRPAENGHLDAIEVLLRHGADPKSQAPYNALGSAALKGRLEVVRFLLDKGADPNGPMELYRSAMGAAAAGGDLEIVKLLLARGGKADGVALRAAAGAGSVDVARLLLDRGVDVNDMENDRTPLVAAVTGRQTEVVRLLLERGAHPNIGSGFNEPTISLAGQFGETEAVRLLLKAGADPDRRGKEGRNALTGVARASLEELLLDYEDFLRRGGCESGPRIRRRRSRLPDQPGQFSLGATTPEPRAAVSE